MSTPLPKAKPSSGQRAKEAPPPHAANNQQRGKKGQQPHANTKATTKATPPEKWVVVIRNVENDFARVHQHALERYCCLNRAAAAASAAATSTADAAKSASPEVYYTVKPRTETRSAEFCVYAPSADADISSVWTPVTVGSSATNDPVEEQAATGAEPSTQPTTATLAGAPRFSSVDDMVSVLKCKPYFTYPPLFMTGGGADATVSSGAEASRKRIRDEDADITDEADEPSGPRTLRGVKQASLVTVHVVSSSVTSQRNLKKVLSSVPGFVTAWTLYPLHFRVVFSDEEALFRAKSLLDQFEAEGLRLTVTLPDGLSRKYEEFLALQADE